jgi:hypothetical protein
MVTQITLKTESTPRVAFRHRPAEADPPWRLSRCTRLAWSHHLNRLRLRQRFTLERTGPCANATARERPAVPIDRDRGSSARCTRKLAPGTPTAPRLGGMIPALSSCTVSNRPAPSRVFNESTGGPRARAHAYYSTRPGSESQ